jgi:branched-chain amino acid transport system substrate-binding protein
MIRPSRLTTVLSGVAVTSIVLAGCGGAATSGSKGSGNHSLTVGLLIPKTGDYASLGKEMKQAADLYMKDHHSKLGGKKAKLVTADSAGSPETGKQKADDLLLHKKVDVLTGVVASPVAVSVADEAEKHKTGLVIANAGANELTGKDVSKYVWRSSYSNFQHGYAGGVYAAKHMSKTDGVFMGADYSAGTETRDGFLAGYKAAGGRKILKKIMTPFGKTSNYQPYLSKIPSKAKFVYSFYAGGEAITFEKDYKKFGYNKKLPLVGAQNLTDEDVLSALGNAGVGVKTVGLYSPALKNQANKKFTKLWAKEYKGSKPAIVAVTMWDAMQLIDKSAEKVKSGLDAKKLAGAFGKAGTITSPRGKVKIDAKSHNPVQNFYGKKLEKKDGEFVNKVLATIPPKSIKSSPSQS